jgi:hypothetical protein
VLLATLTTARVTVVGSPVTVIVMGALSAGVEERMLSPNIPAPAVHQSRAGHD